MKWTYDASADALYVYLSEHQVSPGISAEQLVLDENTIVDLDGAGHVLGFEILDASRGWDLNLVDAVQLTQVQREFLKLVTTEVPRIHQPYEAAFTEPNLRSTTTLVPAA